VNGNQWLNRGQPQTLQNATLLCYIDAVFGLLFGVVASSYFVVLFVIIGLAAGGFGIANERKWGYALAVAAAVVQVVSYIAIFGSDVFGNAGVLLSFLFDVVLVVLLLHPQSRSYQKIWFR
jgi:hypothetical protein